MDTHFREAKLAENLPVLLALGWGDLAHQILRDATRRRVAL